MNLFKILPTVAHREYWAYKYLEPQHIEESNAKWSTNTNTYTPLKMYECGVGFESSSLDIPIRVYLHLSPHSNHAAYIYCSLHVSTSELDREYAESSQIIEVPNLKYASQHSPYK